MVPPPALGPAAERILATALALAAAPSCLGLTIVLLGLERGFRAAPRLGDGEAGRAEPGAAESPEPPPGRLVVVVPAYQEEENIGACVAALLASDLPGEAWELLVVDDDSSDGTAERARAAAVAAGLGAAAAHRPAFTLLAAGPRPADARWVGKNWACHRAWQALQERPQGPPDWLAFVDADVRVGPAALRLALAEARRSGADLLTLAPRLVCGCLAEWLVQPIIVSLLGLSFPLIRANDPDDPLAFAAGPFLLFRREAYAAIGGHRAVAGEVVEDLALARAIKGSGRRLRYLLATDQLSLRMYRDFAALWEGWTKNWLLGLDGSVARALGAGAVVLQLFALPWLLLPPALALAGLGGSRLPLLPVGLAIALQLGLRLWEQWRFGVPARWWWLGGLGGLVIGAIAPVSVHRTLTGQGWTWRGRSLAP